MRWANYPEVFGPSRPPQTPFVELFSISRLPASEPPNLIISPDQRASETRHCIGSAKFPGAHTFRCNSLERPRVGLHEISGYPSAPWVQALAISNRKDRTPDNEGGATQGVEGAVSRPATSRFAACP